nr:dihydrodipicolinate synthase family protein [Chloroflexota bacterium]
MRKMRGVVVAMTTPFTTDGEVDFEALYSEIEFLLKARVHALYPCGTTGEMLFMTSEQREAVAKAVVDKVAGRVPVYIHVGAARIEDTIRLATHAHRIGADGVGVVTPLFFQLNDRELENFYLTVSRSLPQDFPIYMYNIPQCSANDLKPEVCARVVAKCKNVIGIKYSYCDMHRTLDYLQLRMLRDDFSVLVGFDRLLLPALLIGCDGTVSGAASVFPEPFVEAYEKYMAGDMIGAEVAMWRANDIVKKLKAGTSLGTFKEAQRLRGFGGGYVRAPLMEITEQEKESLKQELEMYLYMYRTGDTPFGADAPSSNLHNQSK